MPPSESWEPHLQKPQYTAGDNIGITSSTCRHYTLSNSFMCSDSYRIPILSLLFLYHPYILYFLIQRIFHFLVCIIIMLRQSCLPLLRGLAWSCCLWASELSEALVERPVIFTKGCCPVAWSLIRSHAEVMIMFMLATWKLEVVT